MDEPVCPGCRGALKRIAELEARVTELTRKFEAAMPAGKRQASPFRNCHGPLVRAGTAEQFLSEILRLPPSPALAATRQSGPDAPNAVSLHTQSTSSSRNPCGAFGPPRPSRVRFP